jgi:hypothetical protein
MKYSFDGTPFEFKELKFENNRYLLTLKSVDKKDVSFFLEKKVDGKFEAA